MSRYIDADELERKYMSADYMDNDTAYDVIAELDTAPHINLDDYVPRAFHDKTCEAMAKAHQEEIADMVSVEDYRSMENTCYKLQKALYEMADAPSIDIVRCKECKHWDTADGECYADRGIYFPNANDFCSYGERSKE